MTGGPFELLYLTSEEQSSMLGLNPGGYVRSRFYAQF